MAGSSLGSDCTSTRTGSRSRLSASDWIAGGKVAENSRFWRRGGSSARRRPSSSAKPRSNRRSASSSTSVATEDSVQRVVLDQVQQPARRGDHDVGAAAQRHHLRVDGDAAEGDRDLDRRRQMPRQAAHRLADLRRQLARGHQDQRAQPARRGCGARRRNAAAAAGRRPPSCRSRSGPRRAGRGPAESAGWPRPGWAWARRSPCRRRRAPGQASRPREVNGMNGERVFAESEGA